MMPLAREPILSIADLCVYFSSASGDRAAVKGMQLTVRRGQTVAIVGESGSGKSQSMLAALGLLARNGRATGSVTLAHRQILGLPEAELNRIRGRRIAMIFQEPMTCLDPLFCVGAQICELLQVHQNYSRARAKARAIELLQRVGIDAPEHRMRSYPHELSGGQRQRVMIAMAIANNPTVLIADEPTTALDVTLQAQILELLRSLQVSLGMAVVLISHDLNLVARFASDIYVMRAGAVIDWGTVHDIVQHPRHDYTRSLIAAVPSGGKAKVPADAPIVLTATDIRVNFSLRTGLFKPRQTIRAVDGITLTLRRGQTLGIVGESGSGKSTLGRALLKLIPSSGYIRLEDRNLTGMDRSALRPLRRSMQIVFQDPFGSLSPRMTVGDIVSEGLRVHEPTCSPTLCDQRVAATLDEVGIEPRSRNRFPHEFSGGQRQRIAIARVMILKPQLVILDEPTSALDRAVQRDIVALLRHLQESYGLTYIFISHDLAIIRAVADEILVMRHGRAVEQAETAMIFAQPHADYTRQLIAAALRPPD
jgi:oligopeptide transport system ATP-binding protein